MKKALIIEIGPEYPDPYKIYSPPNDLTNWRSALQTRGFTLIVTLTGLAATRAAIITQSLQFVQSLQSGDSGALVFIGHGSQVADTNRDEADHLDECFVTAQLEAVTDDDIRGVLAQLRPGAKLDVVLECCHAGTGTRVPRPGDAPKVDCFMSQAMAGPVKIKPPQVKAIVPVGAMNHRLWAACADNQVSYGVMSGGLVQSLFSLYLCWALRAYPPKTATEIMNIVAPYVQAVVTGQVPQLEGINLTAVPF